jgi:hypothetical protein
MATHDTNPKPPRATAAEMRRRAKEIRDGITAPTPLTASQQEALERYAPSRVDAAVWEAVRAVHGWVMRRSGIKGTTSFVHQCGIVANYLVWRHGTGAPTAVAEAFTFTAIYHYELNGMADLSDNTRRDYIAKLRTIATRVNPGPDAPPRVATNARKVIQPGYTDAEMAAICRVVTRLGSPVVRRQMCAIVGLCAGAGLSPQDLRNLRAGDIDDRAGDGIVVNVPGARARRTIVRHDFEDMVRTGLKGLGASSLVLGRKVDRRNVTANIIDGAGILEHIPDISAWRLRSTWLLHHMARRVPLGVLLAAAGLDSARTLTDLIQYLPEADVDSASGALRAGEAA